jgi:YVTN family beta-propeller protein
MLSRRIGRRSVLAGLAALPLMAVAPLPQLAIRKDGAVALDFEPRAAAACEDLATNPWIAMGSQTIGVAVNPATSRIYVINAGGFSPTAPRDCVTALDANTNATLGRIQFDTGAVPYALAILPPGGGHGTRLAVTLRDRDEVAIVNIDSDPGVEEGPRIGVGDAPLGLAVDEAGQRIFVANSRSNTVSVIDALTQQVIATLAIGSKPNAVAYNPNNSRLCVSLENSGRVAIFDATVNQAHSYPQLALVTVGGRPGASAADPVSNCFYVVCADTDEVTIIGPNHTVIKRLVGGDFPIALAIDVDRRRLYVAHHFSHDLVVIDVATNRIVTTVPITADVSGPAPCHVAVNPVTNRLYFANLGSSNLAVMTH